MEGKVALVTGRARGIGATTVKLFVEHGTKVVIADIMDELSRSLCDKVGSEDSISYLLRGSDGAVHQGRRRRGELVGAAANLKLKTLREEDVAEAAQYLASDESKYVSGLNLVVDGGFSTTNASFGMNLKKMLLS